MTTGLRDMISDILAQISHTDGRARTEEFSSLRQVDSKVREARILFERSPGLSSVLQELREDPDFEVNSRRVRLEALAGYCRTALKFLKAGIGKGTVEIQRAPDLSTLTHAMPGLKDVFERRWLEAQKCVHYRLYLPAVVLMGSILEGLLLAKASANLQAANLAEAAPRFKGKTVALHDWTLNSLIDVAVELRWLKSDRGRFSHALRISRNVVHPWAEVREQASFDKGTARTCWEVVVASVGDLLEGP